MAKSHRSHGSKTYDFKEGVCIYCDKGDEEDVDCGKLLTDKDGKISVHNYCLLFASGLSQSGEDSDGINGFLLPDIRAEYRRARRLRCAYCTRVRATIGCSVQSCRRGYHFNCGFKKEAVFLFFDTFLSYCVDHRPMQVAPTKPRSQPPVMCPICMDEVEAKVSNQTLRTPCCNNAWFHRTCVQRQALSAGYFFRCAICNNQKEFQEEMKQFGIYIPEHDASWEQEDNAYQELYWRHDNCDIDSCKCPEGRKYNEVSSKWELVLCDLCGSCGCHLACGGLKNVNQDWACSLCSAMLSNATEVNCPSKKSAQVLTSPGGDSPTKIGNSTRTAMKLMGKHPRTPLSAHALRKKSTTTSSELSQGSTPSSHDQLGSLDHCRPSTSKEGLEETGSPRKRKRKLSFNSKENALGEMNIGSHDKKLKKHSSWKKQSVDFCCDHNKAGVKASSALYCGRKTTLRMSMRPRNFSQPSTSHPVPSKSKTVKTAPVAKKKAIHTSGSKTKKRSSLVSSKIEAYFSPVPREMDGNLPLISVKKEKGSSKPVSMKKEKTKVKKVKEAQLQDKVHVAITKSSKCRVKSPQGKSTLIENAKRSPSVGNTRKDTTEKGNADSLAASVESCDQNTSVVKEGYKDKSVRNTLAETPPTEHPVSPTDQEVFFSNVRGCLGDSASFMHYWGDKDSDNDNAVTPSTSGESLESTDVPDLLAENAHTEHGEEDTVRTQCNSPPRDSIQGSTLPDCSTQAIPTALEVTHHVQDRDVGKDMEIQHLSGKFDLRQDISECPTTVSVQNENTDDAIPICNFQGGEQSPASQLEESVSSQVLCEDCPDVKASCDDSTPGSSKSTPKKKSTKKKRYEVYPAVGCFIKKYQVYSANLNTKFKRSQVIKHRRQQILQKQKLNDSRPTKKPATVSKVRKPVHQARVTSCGMLLRRLHSKRSYTPNSTVYSDKMLGEKKTKSKREPSLPCKPPLEVKYDRKKASSIEVDFPCSHKGLPPSLPRRKNTDNVKIESPLEADISLTLPFEISKETLSHPDTVKQARGACLSMHEGQKKQDSCDKSEVEQSTACQLDGEPSPILSALISEDADKISVKPGTTSRKECTHDDAESQEETTSSEHRSPTSKQPNQDHIVPLNIIDDKATKSVDEAVCETPDNNLALFSTPRDMNGPGLEMGRPPSTEPILLSETSPDSGISQSYCCNSDELTTEKPSPMIINEDSFPPWLPLESPSSELCTCKSRKNGVVGGQSQNDDDTSSESEVVYLGNANYINIVEDEPVEKTNDEFGEDAPPSGSESGININDTSRSCEIKNGNCPETASSDSKYATWSSCHNSSQDAEVSLSVSPSSKNFNRIPQDSPSIPPVASPSKPPLLSLEDKDRQVSPDIPYFPAESMPCLKNCTDRHEDTEKRNIPTPERELIQKSLRNVYSKIHVQLEETSQESPSTSCLLSEKMEHEGSPTKTDSANSSEINPSEGTAPEKHETVFDTPIAHNSKCPFCASCKSKHGNNSSSTSMESPTDAAPRPMLLRSNSQGCISPFSPSPVFGKVSPHKPRLYRALLASGSRPTRSSPRTNSPVSFPKLEKNNQSPLLRSYPSCVTESPRSCQTSAHHTLGTWPKKHCSTSRNDPKSSSGAPKSFRVRTLDAKKAKGRVKLFV